MKTPFSTVLIVLRLTPIAAASSACVQPFASRASRSLLPSPAIVSTLEEAEAEQGGDDAGADDEMNGFTRGHRRDAEQRVDRHAGDHRRHEAPMHRAGAIRARRLIV